MSELVTLTKEPHANCTWIQYLLFYAVNPFDWDSTNYVMAFVMSYRNKWGSNDSVRKYLLNAIGAFLQFCFSYSWSLGSFPAHSHLAEGFPGIFINVMKTSIILESIDNILLITRRIKWIIEYNMPLLAGQCWKKVRRLLINWFIRQNNVRQGGWFGYLKVVNNW